MPFDLVIDIENRPGALAEIAKAISDAGVNIAAATCIGPGKRAELHILVPHAEAARHALAISNLAVSREREVVVVEVEDQPGELADLTRRIARAGIDLDLVYVATRNRIVFGAPDLEGLSAALSCTRRAAGPQPLGTADSLPRAAQGRQGAREQLDGGGDVGLVGQLLRPVADPAVTAADEEHAAVDAGLGQDPGIVTAA